jgi:hypothetical protein
VTRRSKRTRECKSHAARIPAWRLQTGRVDLLHIPGQNRLLSLLPADEYDRARTAMEQISHERRALLFGTDEPISHVLLQKAGVIRYQGGMIDVLDREGLEENSCECYWVVRNEYERLLC